MTSPEQSWRTVAKRGRPSTPPIAVVRLALAVAVAVATLISGVAATKERGASSTADSTSNASKKRTSRTQAPSPPHPVRFSCPEALDDGTLTDGRFADVLAALANGLHWEGGYGLPGTCHREVRLVCGPDLDHDGDRDAIVQLAWWQPQDEISCAAIKGSGDYWPVTYTLLATKHQATWRAVAPLGVGLFADAQELRGATDFVKLSGGQIGVMLRWSNVSSDNGCRIAGHEIFALQQGSLQKLQTADDSPPCTPCCERP